MTIRDPIIHTGLHRPCGRFVPLRGTGRVDTRPYAGLAVVRRARGYAPLQGASAAWGLPFRHKRPPCGSSSPSPIALSERPLIRHPASVRRRMPPSPRGGKALSEPRLLLPNACCLLPNSPNACCLLPDRQISILHSQFSIQPQDLGLTCSARSSRSSTFFRPRSCITVQRSGVLVRPVTARRMTVETSPA